MERKLKERYLYTPLDRLEAPAQVAAAEVRIEAVACLFEGNAPAPAETPVPKEWENDPLLADNLGARSAQGFRLTVPQGTDASGIIEIDFDYPASYDSAAKIFLRSSIRIENQAEARIVLRHRPASNRHSVINHLLRIEAGNGSSLQLAEVCETRATLFSTVLIGQEEKSQLKYTTADLDNDLLRRNTLILLHEPECECTLSGLYIADGEQHTDNHVEMLHLAPHCTSHQLFKGIVGGAASGAFTGHILVAPDAQKSDATLQNHNLLRGGDATVDTRPQLEIYADDVQCSHGATVGRLDEQAVYYMRQRGISLEAARRLQTEGFAAEVVDTIEIDDLPRLLRKKIAQRLENKTAGVPENSR